MTDHRSEQVSEKTARRLLERAAILDQSGLTLDQLRHAAAEAGISAEAFDKAVEEWRRPDRFDPPESKRAWPVRVLRNLAAGVVGWAAFATLMSIERLMGVPGVLEKLSEPIGLGIGAMVAARLRARTALIVLSGLTLSQGAEFVLDAIAGTPTIRGAGAHLALMAAGVTGVWVGATLSRISGGSWARRESDRDAADATRESKVADESISRGVRLTCVAAAKGAIDGARFARTFI
jgi:hypothetical protein